MSKRSRENNAKTELEFNHSVRSIEIQDKKVILHPIYLIGAIKVCDKALEMIIERLESTLRKLDEANEPTPIDSEELIMQVNQIGEVADFDGHKLFNDKSFSDGKGPNGEALPLREYLESQLSFFNKSRDTLVIHSSFEDQSSVSLSINIFSEMISFANTKLLKIIRDIKENPSIQTMKEYQLCKEVFKELMSTNEEDVRILTKLDNYIADNYLRLTGVCKVSNVDFFNHHCATLCFQDLKLEDVYHPSQESATPEILELAGDVDPFG